MCVKAGWGFSGRASRFILCKFFSVVNAVVFCINVTLGVLFSVGLMLTGSSIQHPS